MMKNSGITRKEFLKNTAFGVAGLTIVSGFLNKVMAASVELNSTIKNTRKNLISAGLINLLCITHITNLSHKALIHKEIVVY